MVLVEFFDRSPVENLAGCLADRPEKVIFLGKRREMEAQAPAIRRFLEAVGLRETETEFRSLPGGDMAAAVNMLEAIAEAETGCCFDLTGGAPVAIAAAGIVYDRMREKGIRLRCCNVSAGKAYDLSPMGQSGFSDIPALGVAENILLHGGVMVSAAEKKGGTVDWALSEAFRAEVLALWQICRSNPNLWNTQISALSAMEKVRQETEDPLRFQVNVSHAVDFLTHQRMKLKTRELYPDLERAGLIGDVRYDGREFSFRYRNARIRRMLDKAGTVLELYTYLTALSLRDRAGRPLFGDGRTGVLIDWDGHINAGADTENEIDVLLMRGLTPWFVSCKNGAVGHEELYKLHTVAERFGGGYGKKLLVATTFGRDADNKAYFQGRARDMDIVMLDGVHELTEAEFAQKLLEIAGEA